MAVPVGWPADRVERHQDFHDGLLQPGYLRFRGLSGPQRVRPSSLSCRWRGRQVYTGTGFRFVGLPPTAGWLVYGRVNQVEPAISVGGGSEILVRETCSVPHRFPNLLYAHSE